jgi:hypothetical protein
MIAQGQANWVMPFLLKCRNCGDYAQSTIFALAQDVLADAHVEFTYEGVKEGYGPSGCRDLRPPAKPEKETK